MASSYKHVFKVSAYIFSESLKYDVPPLLSKVPQFPQKSCCVFYSKAFFSLTLFSHSAGNHVAALEELQIVKVLLK